MSAYVIFDVEIRDMARYQDFMKAVKPALDSAGARYLARGGAHKVYEGAWPPLTKLGVYRNIRSNALHPIRALRTP